MLRMLSLSMLLFFFLALIIDAALTIGGTQSTSKHLAIFHLTSCQLPCWIGIQPGKTTISEAHNLVMKYFADLVLQKANGCDNDWKMYLTGKEISLYVQFNYRDCNQNDVVRTLTLNISKNGNPLDIVSIGQLYGLIGIPDKITVYGNNSILYTTLQYTKHNIWVILNQGVSGGIIAPVCTGIDPNLTMWRIEMFSQLPKENDLSFIPEIWTGFRSCYHLFGKAH